jgi:5-carboxymethyl-2-hydroxymuconate isomerase
MCFQPIARIIAEVTKDERSERKKQRRGKDLFAIPPYHHHHNEEQSRPVSPPKSQKTQERPLSGTSPRPTTPKVVELDKTWQFEYASQTGENQRPSEEDEKAENNNSNINQRSGSPSTENIQQQRLKQFLLKVAKNEELIQQMNINIEELFAQEEEEPQQQPGGNSQDDTDLLFARDDSFLSDRHDSRSVRSKKSNKSSSTKNGGAVVVDGNSNDSNDNYDDDDDFLEKQELMGSQEIQELIGKTFQHVGSFDEVELSRLQAQDRAVNESQEKKPVQEPPQVTVNNVTSEENTAEKKDERRDSPILVAEEKDSLQQERAADKVTDTVKEEQKQEAPRETQNEITNEKSPTVLVPQNEIVSSAITAVPVTETENEAKKEKSPEATTTTTSKKTAVKEEKRAPPLIVVQGKKKSAESSSSKKDPVGYPAANPTPSSSSAIQHPFSQGIVRKDEKKGFPTPSSRAGYVPSHRVTAFANQIMLRPSEEKKKEEPAQTKEEEKKGLSPKESEPIIVTKAGSTKVPFQTEEESVKVPQQSLPERKEEKEKKEEQKPPVPSRDENDYSYDDQDFLEVETIVEKEKASPAVVVVAPTVPVSVSIVVPIKPEEEKEKEVIQQELKVEPKQEKKVEEEEEPNDYYEDDDFAAEEEAKENGVKEKEETVMKPSEAAFYETEQQQSTSQVEEEQTKERTHLSPTESMTEEKEQEKLGSATNEETVIPKKDKSPEKEEKGDQQEETTVPSEEHTKRDTSEGLVTPVRELAIATDHRERRHYEEEPIIVPQEATNEVNSVALKEVDKSAVEEGIEKEEPQAAVDIKKEETDYDYPNEFYEEEDDELVANKKTDKSDGIDTVTKELPISTESRKEEPLQKQEELVIVPLEPSQEKPQEEEVKGSQTVEEKDKTAEVESVQMEPSAEETESEIKQPPLQAQGESKDAYEEEEFRFEVSTAENDQTVATTTSAPSVAAEKEVVEAIPSTAVNKEEKDEDAVTAPRELPIASDSRKAEDIREEEPKIMPVELSQEEKVQEVKVVEAVQEINAVEVKPAAAREEEPIEETESEIKQLPVQRSVDAYEEEEFEFEVSNAEIDQTIAATIVPSTAVELVKEVVEDVNPNTTAVASKEEKNEEVLLSPPVQNNQEEEEFEFEVSNVEFEQTTQGTTTLPSQVAAEFVKEEQPIPIPVVTFMSKEEKDEEVLLSPPTQHHQEEEEFEFEVSNAEFDQSLTVAAEMGEETTDNFAKQEEECALELSASLEGMKQEMNYEQTSNENEFDNFQRETANNNGFVSPTEEETSKRKTEEPFVPTAEEKAMEESTVVVADQREKKDEVVSLPQTRGESTDQYEEDEFEFLENNAVKDQEPATTASVKQLVDQIEHAAAETDEKNRENNVESSELIADEKAAVPNMEGTVQNDDEESSVVKDEFDVVTSEPPGTVDETQKEEAKKEELVHELVETIAAEIKKEGETVTKEDEAVIEPPIANDGYSIDEFDVVTTEPPGKAQETEKLVEDRKEQEEAVTEVDTKKEEVIIEPSIAANDGYSIDEFDVVAAEPRVTHHEPVAEEEGVASLGSDINVQNREEEEEEQPTAKDVYSNDEFDVVATEPAATVNGTEKEEKEELVHELVEAIAAEIKKEEESSELITDPLEATEQLENPESAPVGMVLAETEDSKVVTAIISAKETVDIEIRAEEDEQPIAKDTSSNDEFDVVATEQPVTQEEEMATEEEAKKEELVHELVEAIAAEIKKEEETVTEEEAKKEDSADSEINVQNQEEEEQAIAKDVYSSDEFDVVATEPAATVNGRENEDEEKQEFVELIAAEIKKEEETLTEEEAEVAIEPPVVNDGYCNDEFDVVATEQQGKVDETEKEDEAKKEEVVHELVEAIAAEIQKEEEGESPELVAEIPEVKEQSLTKENDNNGEFDVVPDETQVIQDETVTEHEEEKKKKEELVLPTKSSKQPAAVNYEDDEFDVVGEAPAEVHRKEDNNGAVVEDNKEVLSSLELPPCSPLTVQDGQQDGQSVTYFDSPVEHSSFRREDSLMSRSRLASEGSMMSEFLSDGSSSIVVNNNDEFLPLLREHPLTALATTINNIQLQLPEGKQEGSVLTQRNLFLVFKIGKKIKFYTRR